MRSRIAWGGAALLSTFVCAQAAVAAGLPTVSSGERPGPPLLYAPPPSAPELSVQAPFAAKPLLVSGTDALRNGEYLYQDYLFDDHGANTAPGPGTQPPGSGNFSATAGDVSYPTAARFANNAADIVELRVRRTADAVVYRVTLGSVLDDDTTVVGIGINSDASGGEQVQWPRGAGISSPGLDRFVTAWGTGGQVTDLSGAPATTSLPAGSVTIDQATNQMTIRVPDSAMPAPGGATWRLVAGAGLFTGDATEGGNAWKDASPGDPGAETPGSGSASSSPFASMSRRAPRPTPSTTPRPATATSSRTSRRRPWPAARRAASTPTLTSPIWPPGPRRTCTLPESSRRGSSRPASRCPRGCGGSFRSSGAGYSPT